MDQDVDLARKNSSLKCCLCFRLFLWQTKIIFRHDFVALLRHKKMSKKVVKICDFLQCWVHIFLGHDGCFWKINLRILGNHIMNSFQVKHGQCYSIIFHHIPKHFLLKALSNNLTFALLTLEFCTFGISWNLSTNLS